MSQTSVERPHFTHQTTRQTVRRTARMLVTGVAVAAVAVTVAATSAQAAGNGSTPRTTTVTAQSAQAATVSPTLKKKKSGTTYYVSPAGKDSNHGESRSAAVRSLDAVSNLPLQAGDKVLLKRGASYSGTLDVSASGVSGNRITIGAYGTDKKAPLVTGRCITVNGNYVLVVGVKVANCPEAGVRVFGDNVIVRDITATGSWAGIEVMESANRTQILRNRVIDNKRMAPGMTGDNDDNGAFGVLVHGDNTEIAWNTISGQVAPSPDYGTDGSAVEIYGGIGTYVHHNYAINNKAFTELGNKRTANTRYEYNVSVSSVPFSDFLVTRGAQDFFGPIPGTTASNNTVRYTGNGSQGFYCYGGCTPSVMTLNNNILDISGRIGYADGAFGGGGNIYWHGSLETPMLPGDKYADPKFMNTTNDLHVAPSSVAVDTGSTTSTGKDIDGRNVPIDGNGDGQAAADTGAYETAAN